MKQTRTVIIAATSLMLTSIVAGCGGSQPTGSSTTSGGGQNSSGQSSPSESSSDPTIAAEVPANVRKTGLLKVGTSADYAPIEFVANDGKTIVGVDPDLAKAIAQIMGLKAQMMNSSYDSLTPSLTAGRYDMLMAGVQDVKQREATVDFVNYMQMGTLFYVKTTGGPSINSLADLCGHSVAMQKGTTQQIDATKQNKKCGGNVKVEVYPSQNEVNLAVQSGRADVGMADAAPVLYQVKKSNGQFKVSGQPYAVALDGIVVPKGSKLVKPLKDAVNKLISNGTYAAILKKWGVSEVGIKSAEVNGAKF